MTGYDVTYSQRRMNVPFVAGTDKTGKVHAFSDAPVILNMNGDRLTSITVLDLPNGKAVARLPRATSAVSATGTDAIILGNLMAGNSLHAVEVLYGK